ncbi:hypothetical protein [Vulcanisaeta souniana]|uniref:Uncharacterized protein n=1 Tax=Vulcanisaeta souniana JCM 11219 TaxID=1293586 RepID=A0ABN6SS42_9CREN|nr:hypothetical protein [Vulcanisaeta souniana]BDR92628.1 hypothetical protein Vsou_17210 [Vulcanisaeta souniana JCM 11219]
MLKYVILVISSYVDSGTKDFTAYFFTKDTNEAKPCRISQGLDNNVEYCLIR